MVHIFGLFFLLELIVVSITILQSNVMSIARQSTRLLTRELIMSIYPWVKCMIYPSLM